MIEAKQLIEMNNKRRTELTPENEKYYSDFLIYIRLQLFLSEQQSEEILMEILDHLIEGQNEGKSAREIFGDDPKAFADKLIEQIPKENKRNLIRFFSSIVLGLVSYFFMIRGVVILVVGFFKDVDIVVYPVKSVVVSLLIITISLGSIGPIFKIVSRSLFSAKKTEVSYSIKIALVAMAGMGIIVVTNQFFPAFGPKFDFPWYASLITGGLVWGASRWLKNW
jgi:uncharacterized membrane-anchored protein